MHIIKPLFVIAIVALVGMGCSPETPSRSGSVETYPGELSKSQYDALTDEQKYQVSNKLLGTIFRGIPVADFFDISNGMNNLTLKEGGNLLYRTKVALSESLTDEQRQFYDTLITGYKDVGGERDVPGKYKDVNQSLDSTTLRDWPKILPMARMMEFPLSKDFFDHFVAYTLTNTILFAPGEEMDSTSIRDVQKVYNKLYSDLSQGKTVREIIARHQNTQENWRRFRSPEDNTREMIEIYLGLFDRDADVPRASKACQDLYLTDGDNNYELLSTGYENTDPQYVLDTYVVTCEDFYNVIADHPLVMPRMATVMVEYFFPAKTSNERAAVVSQIMAGNPTTFQEIFKSILFSRAYLLDNERPRSFEESFFAIAHQTKWRPYRDMFIDLTDNSVDGANLSGSNNIAMENMGWPVMTLKLGRFTSVPLDALSFATYHKGLRESVLIDDRYYGSNGSCNDLNTDDTNTNRDSSRCDWSEGLGLVEPDEPVRPEDRGLAGDPLDIEIEKYEHDMARYQRDLAVFNQVQALSVDDFLDYLFMSVANRRATDTEKTAIKTMIGPSSPSGRNYIREDSQGDLYVYVNEGNTNRVSRTYYDEVAKVVFDYLSRLPELYYFEEIN